MLDRGADCPPMPRQPDLIYAEAEANREMVFLTEAEAGSMVIVADAKDFFIKILHILITYLRSNQQGAGEHSRETLDFIF